MPPNSPTDLIGTIIAAQAGVGLAFRSDEKAAGTWYVRDAQLREQISGSYALQLQLITRRPDAAATPMLGKNASLSWERDGFTRHVHGIVTRVEDGDFGRDETRCHLTVEPALAALKHTSCSRIFEGQSIPEVVQAVLLEKFKVFGRELAVDLAHGPYPVREYIVQHRERDFDFVTRLLAEQGIWYYFDHPSDSPLERLVLTDSPRRAHRVADDADILLSRDKETSAEREAITAFGASDQVRTTEVRVRHFDWTHSDRISETKKHVADAAGRSLVRDEHGDVSSFEYKALHYQQHDAEAQTQLRLDAYRSDRHTLSGESNVVCLRPGHFMKVEGKEYLILSVSHGIDAAASTGASSHRGDYHNRFTCLPREQVYRPDRIKKPTIVGIQTAMVVDEQGGKVTPESGAQGDDIATDEYGRVRVKFHWDTTPAGAPKPTAPASGPRAAEPAGKVKPTTSAWLRVAQAWAGAGWGSQFVPRVGMEVVVQFIDGDPDQPLVTGCVYNGENRPPYAATPTQSGIKTQSSIKPGDYNELRFDDASGHEQIYVRAQKDYVEDVLNDHTTTVTGKQTQLVKKSQTETVNGNANLSVGGKRTKNVGGDKEHGEEISIKGERKTTVSKKHTEIFQDEHEVTVTKAVKENYLATHERTVTEKQTLEAKADKLEHVVGTYELTTDTAYILNQAGTKLTLEGGKVALDAAGAISVTRGPATIDIDDGGNIAFKTTGAISFEVGPNKIMISMSGIELESPMGVSAKVAPSELALTPASANLKSVNTTVEATAVCAIKGAAMVGLNS